MEQISIEQFLYPKFSVDKPIRLIELFAGIGAQAKALQRIGAKFEHYRVCEFDKYAVQSYNAVHGTDFEPSDICNWSGNDLGVIDTDEYCYILTYSFPCQDLSLAGKQKGMSKNTSTRSGLLWEVERLLKETKNLPHILLMENVPQVHGAKNISDFRNWMVCLESLGYKNYWEDLNAKNHGIPQSRDRTFMISLLGNFHFAFPRPQKLEKCLADLLENEVLEKYYLMGAQIDAFKSSTFNQEKNKVQNSGGVCRTLCARDYKSPLCVKNSTSERTRKL